MLETFSINWLRYNSSSGRFFSSAILYEKRKFSDLRLDTERLQLRRFCPEDLAHVIEWCEDGAANSDSEAQRFLDFCFRQYEQRGEGPCAMVLKATQKIVGNCGYIGIQQFCGELNYYVAPQYRGLGLATEAVRTLLDFGFRELGLLRVQARCAPDNPASEKVLRKIGMKFTGLLDGAPGAGTPSGEKLYSVFRQDFEKLEEPPRD